VAELSITTQETAGSNYYWKLKQTVGAG